VLVKKKKGQIGGQHLGTGNERKGNITRGMMKDESRAFWTQNTLKESDERPKKLQTLNERQELKMFLEQDTIQ